MEEVNQLTQERETILHDFKSNLISAKDQMKVYANKYRRTATYAVGDWVYLKLQPCRLKSLAKKLNDKLGPRFYGTYQMNKVISQLVDQIENPAESKICSSFMRPFLRKL